MQYIAPEFGETFRSTYIMYNIIILLYTAATSVINVVSHSSKLL